MGLLSGVWHSGRMGESLLLRGQALEGTRSRQGVGEPPTWRRKLPDPQESAVRLWQADHFLGVSAGGWQENPADPKRYREMQSFLLEWELGAETVHSPGTEHEYIPPEESSPWETLLGQAWEGGCF